MDEIFYPHQQKKYSNLYFYWFDISDNEMSRPGSILLFGKILDMSDQSFKSTCIIVNNLERKLYLCPKDGYNIQNVIEEVNKIRKELNIRSMKIKVTKKKYVFEIDHVPRGENIYLEIVYPYNENIFPERGETFSHVFRTKTKESEQFIIEKNLEGPSWLKIRNFKETNRSLTWCEFEYIVDDPLNINVAEDILDFLPTSPNFTSMCLKVQSIPAKNQIEIFAISIAFNNSYNIEEPSSHDKFSYKFTLMRHLPHTNITSYKNIIFLQNEMALLSYFLTLLRRFDPDIIIGHDLFSNDLFRLISRIKHFNLPTWSLLGRIKLKEQLKFRNYNTESSIFSLTSGRLICDIFLLAKDFLTNFKDFTITFLSKRFLELDIEEFNDYKMLEIVQNTKLFENYCSYIINIPDILNRIAMKMDVLALTKELTHLCGYIWTKTLLGGKFKRNEYLLMHKFHSQNYIYPDKRQTFEFNKKRKIPHFRGGLVLEPKIGFYDNFILVLDFISLYPSVIRQYNICFSTVTKNIDSSGNWLPSNLPEKDSGPGILPEVITELVLKRKQIKSMYDKEDNPTLKYQYYIKQYALKITANSMYGCLGFKYSRFYGVHLAELVTRMGRNALEVAKTVSEYLKFDIIYGDTDSIMINTHSKDYHEVIKMRDTLISYINSKFTEIEIDTEGIFSKLLIYKKKMYAGLKCRLKENGKGFSYSKEIKGLYLVRRDWCQLSNEIGNNVLDIIFDEKSGDIINKIKGLLRKYMNDIRDNKIPIEKYSIRKSLIQDPENYENPYLHPHVKVALDLRNKNILIKEGHIIEYVICKNDETSLLSMKARSVEDLNSDDIDKEWYITSQIFPSLLRLCTHIDGVDEEFIANSLGMKKAKRS